MTTTLVFLILMLVSLGPVRDAAAACPPDCAVPCGSTDCNDNVANTRDDCTGPPSDPVCRNTQEFFAQGQGGGTGDCMMEWLLRWPPNAAPPNDLKYSLPPLQVGSRQRCEDGASCDLDGEVNGRCMFELRMCFCVGDPSITDCRDLTRPDFCAVGTGTPTKPGQYRFNPPSRPTTGGATWPAKQYTCNQYYAQLLKERLTGLNLDANPGADTVDGNTGAFDDAHYRVAFVNETVGISPLTPTSFPGIAYNEPAATWPCTEVLPIIVPVRRKCTYRERTVVMGGVPQTQKRWVAAYRSGKFSPKGYFVVRPGYGEVDKSGDRLTLECVPFDYPKTEWDEPSPDNHCLQSAPCCGQPEALGIAPNTHCCKVGSTPCSRAPAAAIASIARASGTP
jgi:hypothetical protein